MKLKLATARPSFHSRSVSRLDSGAIDLDPGIGDDRWSPAELSRATWAFVAFGVSIRVIRFLLAHPLWGDECFVAANLIERNYLGLLRPLDYQQVVPFLFLWVQLSIARLLGYSEMTLRLFPTACAVASLFVVRHLASRLMKGLPVLIVVAIVAVSTNPIRHGNEAKPYAVDFLASAILLTLMVEWWRKPDRAAWVWGLAGATPLAMGLSLPSVFVLGGISLAMLGRVLKDRGPQVVSAYLTFNLMIVAVFAATLALYRVEGSAEVKAYMDYYWSGMFPPLSDPTRLLIWLIRAHTGQLFAYPVGGANGASLLTVILTVAGLADLIRKGRGMVVMACVIPLGLALVASMARAYPYGESERLMQFEGPMVCLLAGSGLAGMIGRFRRPAIYRKLVLSIVAAFVAIGAGSIMAGLVNPYRSIMDQRAREFARWFWTEAGRDAELACVRVDLGLDFEGGPNHDGRSANYLTYQKIFSARHHSGKPLEWSKISAAHPLRCVLYDGVPIDSALFEAWMGRMVRYFRLSRVETYRVNSGETPRSVPSEDHFTILEFAPISAPIDPSRLASEALVEIAGSEPRP